MGLKLSELLILAVPAVIVFGGTFFAGYAMGKGRGFKEGLRERERIVGGENAR